MNRKIFMDGKCIGQLMPQNDDSRQQPKSLCHKLLEKRHLDDIWRSLIDANWPPTWDRNSWRPNLNTVSFIRFGDGGSVALDRYTGQALGTILPTVPVENLQFGIQSWSKPESCNHVSVEAMNLKLIAIQ